ncbi:unnamed protein product [Lupinus luteus]|uniref:Uncharacterized protein n=1 Tax=Lupinus luteus TaxID=3873 RepID=A0AAV1WBE8_LUPLU
MTIIECNELQLSTIIINVSEHLIEAELHENRWANLLWQMCLFAFVYLEFKAYGASTKGLQPLKSYARQLILPFSILEKYMHILKRRLNKYSDSSARYRQCQILSSIKKKNIITF